MSCAEIEGGIFPTSMTTCDRHATRPTVHCIKLGLPPLTRDKALVTGSQHVSVASGDLRPSLWSVSVMLVRKFGYRKVTMCGGLLACLSFVLSTQSPNVVCFVLSYGLFT
ncbi:hypothetical protein ElyMa_005820400, partial [Elysia marginata]